MNDDKRFGNIEFGPLLGIVSVAVSYQFYEKIKDNTLLKIFLLSLLVILVLLSVASIYEFLTQKKLLFYSKFASILWVGWILAFFSCLMLGFILDITEKDEPDIEIELHTGVSNNTGYEKGISTIDESYSDYSDFENSDTSLSPESSKSNSYMLDESTTEMQAWNEENVQYEDGDGLIDLERDLYDVSLSNGLHGTKVAVSSINFLPYFSLEFRNDSDDTIIVNDNKAMGIELLQFIPYDQFEVEGENGGADGWDVPIEFKLNMTDELGIQFASRDTGDNEELRKDAYLKIPENDIQKFNLTIYPEEKGYYRFKVFISYDCDGKTKVYKSKEFIFVCTQGLNNVSSNRDGLVLKSPYEENAQSDADDYDGKWRCVAQDEYLPTGYIWEFVNYEYNSEGYLEHELHFDSEKNYITSLEYIYNKKHQLVETQLGIKGDFSSYSDGYVIYNNVESNAYTCDYDRKGRCVSKNFTNIKHKSEQYKYDNKDNLIEKRTKGSTYSYTYDDSGRLIISECKSKNVSYETRYEYDENDHLILETDAYYTYKYSYDKYGNMIKKEVWGLADDYDQETGKRPKVLYRYYIYTYEKTS